MGLFGLFGGKKDNSSGSGVLDVAWSKNASNKFRRLPFVEAAKEKLQGVKAVYVIWHGGVRPGWVYVGLADDLSMDIMDCKQNKEIMEYDLRGGCFITWYTFNDKMAPGVFAFLTEVLQPSVRNPEADMYRSKAHVKVLPPGYTQETFKNLL